MNLKLIYIKKFALFKEIQFWADMLIYFCIFSIVGHLLELPYCIFNDYFFNIVSDDSGVWGYPFEPFFVYGVAVVFLIIFIEPMYKYLSYKIKNKAMLIFIVFLLSIAISLIFELGMGLIFNQPVNGVYPMWDNSKLPGNIFGQAWIVNDILLGCVSTVFVAFIYPLMQRFLDKFTKHNKIILTLIVLMLFIVNIYITYGIFCE